MDNLGRYPISVILSFLTESEGCSLLITRRKWALQLLPQFRLPSRMLTQTKNFRHRHRFIVAPVQDATTRLDRLNTRRWKKRNIKRCNKTTNQVATQEWEERKSSKAYPPLLRLPDSNNKIANEAFQKGITLLVSYPRSGNTFLRSLLESITGVVTCSDTRPDRTLSLALAEKHDLVGEGLCRPPICKTHWPERIGCQRYMAQRAILVVRNPWDVIDSYWNLNLTNTHTEKVTDEIYNQFQDFFAELAANEMKVWLDFHNFWFSTSIPLLVIRYEDLILNPRPEMEKILQFYTSSAIDDWKTRLDTVLADNRSHGYKPESSAASLSVGGSVRRGRYPSLLLSSLENMDGQGWLQKFGYHVQLQGFPNNLDSLPLVPQQSSRGHDDKPILINRPEIDLRPPNCPYGRNMRSWRRKHTLGDTQPFPIVPKKIR